MVEWIAENWLALYGSIVGTVALIINFSGFIHTIRKDRVKVKVSVCPHPRKTENINHLKSSQDKEGSEKLNLVEVYLVTIRNIGTVDAYIENAGVISKQGNYHSVLVSTSIGNGSVLVNASDTKIEPIAPKSPRTFKVYLKSEQEPFEAKWAFAVDSTGKEWRARA